MPRGWEPERARAERGFVVPWTASRAVSRDDLLNRSGAERAPEGRGAPCHRRGSDFGSDRERCPRSENGVAREALNREVIALDLTSDLGIPVFAGLSHRGHGEQERILFGLGCHLDARIALQRALTEISQMLSFELAGKASLDKELGNGWLTWATRENQPYLAPDDTAPVRTRDDFPSAGHPDLLDSIEFCRRKVEALGMEMLVLDQTRTDVGMPVVKVVVPGLRHFWARFAPGRLYDVPVALGWRPAPMAEEDLNPVPVFW